MIIIALLLLLYIINKNLKNDSMYSPSSVMIICWMVYLSIEKMYSLYLGIDGIGIQTYMVIYLSLAFFCIGGCIAVSMRTIVNYDVFCLSDRLVKWYSCFVMLICLAFIYIQIQKTGLQLFSFDNQYIEAFYNIRKSSIDELNDVNIFSNIFEMLKLITLYIFFRIKKDNKKLTSNKLFSMALFVLGLAFIFTGAKQNVITFFISLLVVDIYSKNAISIKTLLLVASFAVVLFAMLYILNNANIARADDIIGSIVQIFEGYVISSIYGFDTVISSDFNPGYNGGWLKPIYALFYRIGLIDEYPITHMDYFYNQGVVSNIYTGLFFYYQNFALLELMVMMIVNGFIYQLVYQYLKGNHMFPTMLFPVIMSSLILSPINGNLFADSSASLVKYILVYKLFKKINNKLSDYKG